MSGSPKAKSSVMGEPVRIGCIFVFAFMVCATPFFIPSQGGKVPVDWAIMHGFLGLSDMQWSSLLNLIGALLCLTVGYLLPRPAIFWTAAVMLGIPAHVLCNVMLYKEGGLITLAGLLLVPACFAGGGYVGQYLRRLRNQRRKAVS